MLCCEKCGHMLSKQAYPTKQCPVCGEMMRDVNESQIPASQANGMPPAQQPNQGPIPGQAVPQKPKKNKTKWIAAVVAVIALVLLIFQLTGKNDGQKEMAGPSSTGTTAARPTGSSTTKPTGTGNTNAWSEWYDQLPFGVNADRYEIEERVLYRSREQELTETKDPDSLGDSWEIYKTEDISTTYTSWSEWSSTPVNTAPSRQVQVQARYRFRERRYTWSSIYPLDGWTCYDFEFDWSDYGDWSGWSTSVPTSDDSTQVQSKTQYSYRTKIYTTDREPSLDGWNRYGSGISYGSWSDWGTTPISSSSTLEVETRQVKTGTRYFVAHYCTGYVGDSNNYCSANFSFHDKCAYHVLGWFDSLDDFSVDGNQVIYYQNGKRYTCSNTCYKFFIMDSETVYETQYRAREFYTFYYFYQWGPWSGYSDAYVSSADDVEVRTRTVYRYRSRQQYVSGYYYYRWGEWSNWSTSYAYATDDRQVEEMLYYRYRDYWVTTVYYARRWKEWTEYSEKMIVPTENIEVETKVQYRYRGK